MSIHIASMCTLNRLSLLLLTLFITPSQAGVSDLDKKFGIDRTQARKTAKQESKADANKKRQKVAKSAHRSDSSDKKTQKMATYECETDYNSATEKWWQSRPTEPTVKITGLYGGEEINMPRELMNRVAPYNEKIKGKLSEQEFLILLKGELAWYIGQRGDKVSSIDYSTLLEKLEQIEKEPQADGVLRWPRLISSKHQGIYAKEILTEKYEVVYCDEKYSISGIPNDDFHFALWDVRTGEQVGIIEAPFPIRGYSITRIANSNCYFVTVDYPKSVASMSRIEEIIWNNGMWHENHCGFAMLIDPVNVRSQCILFSRHSLDGYYDPCLGETMKNSNFPLKKYLSLKPSRAWRSPENTYSFHRLREEDSEDDFFADKNRSLAYENDLSTASSFLGLGTTPDRDCLILNFSDKTLKFIPSELKVWPAEETDSSHEHTALVERIRNKVAFTTEDAFSPSYCDPHIWEEVEALSTDDGYAIFTLTSPYYNIDKYYSIKSQLSGIVYPDGAVKEMRLGHTYLQDFQKRQYGSIPEGVKLSPEEEAGGEEAYTRMLKPFAITKDGDTIVSKWCHVGKGIITRTINVKTGKFDEKEEVIHNFELSFGKPEIYVTRLTDSANHFRFHKRGDDGNLSPIVDLHVNDDGDYAFVLPNGEYCGNPGCESMLRYSDGTYSVSMQAFAPWRNRPANILKVLGGKSDDIAALEATTLRWLGRIRHQATEPALSKLPQVRVEYPALKTHDKNCAFTVHLTAKDNDITSLQVTINSVPYAVNIPELPLSAGGELDINLNLPLINGQNWISITPIDSNNAMGDTVRFRTICDSGNPGILHIIALGVSQYENSDLTLKYAAKDAEDVASTFQVISDGNCRVLKLTDAEVTSSITNKIKDFISAAKPEDSVVIYIAGHGMVNQKLDYYFAPFNFDPENIECSGIAMNDILDAIKSTPARKRLLLLDTCHSGQMGEEGEEKMAIAFEKLPEGVRAIQTRGMKLKQADAINPEQHKRYIEELFSLGTADHGINIISAAAGAEFALESGEWNNGLFTACLLEVITNSGDADYNRDGLIRLPELASYLQNRVAKLTGGTQHPSVTLTRDAAEFTLSKGLRYCLLKSDDTKWMDFLSMLSRCRKTDMSFNQSYPDIFGEGCLSSAPKAVLEMAQRLTNTQTKLDDQLLVNACWQTPTNELLNRLRFLLSNGCNPNAKEDDGTHKTPLLLLSMRCYEEGDESEKTIMDCIQLLLEHGADDALCDAQGRSPRDFDLGIQNIDSQQRLNSAEALLRQTWSSNPELAKKQIKDVFVDRYANDEFNEILVSYQAVATSDDNSYALMLDVSFEEGSPRVVSSQLFALNKQADVKQLIRNVSQRHYNMDNKRGNYLEEMLSCIATGEISVNESEVPRSCLKTMLGKIVDTPGVLQGATALHLACMQDSYISCMWLLSKGADTGIKDNMGKIPADYAHGLNEARILRALKEAAKDSSTEPGTLRSISTSSTNKNPIEGESDGYGTRSADSLLKEGMDYAYARNGKKQDYVMTRKLYEAAAARGSSEAMYRLARMHRYKLGDCKEPAQARSWYQKAADLGHSKAKKELNEMR